MGYTITRIGDVCSLISSGGTPKRSEIEYYGGTINWIKTQELNDCYIFETEEKITELGLNNSSAKLFPVGTISMAMYGATVGKLGIMKVPCSTNQACCNMVVNDKEMLYMFLYYSLLNERENIVRKATGAAQQNISIAIISNYLVTKPSISIQTKIVRILQSLDNKIRNNNLQSDILKKELQNLYQSWFCDALVQKSWDSVFLYDVIERVTKKNNPLQTEITITISAKFGITSNYYTKRVASKDLSNYTVVEKGDFIYNRSSSEGYPVGVICRLEEFDRVALSPIYFCFRAKNIVSAKFLTYYFNSEGFTNSLYQIVGIGSRGHGMLNFNMNDFMKINITTPPKPLQQKFETVIKPFEQKIAKLREENKVLTEIRDALLPKLMSGELPVEEGEN